MSRVLSLAAVLFASFCTPLGAQIYRWDNGQVIPGTEGIALAPGVRLDGLDLESAARRRQPVGQIQFGNDSRIACNGTADPHQINARREGTNPLRLKAQDLQLDTVVVGRVLHGL